MIDQPPFRFVALDSQLDPGEVGGAIGSEQLQWLESVLRYREPARTILFVHHPGESASEGCRDFGSLFDLAAGCGHVQAIVTGHDHAYSLDRDRGVHLVGLPSAGFPFDPGDECGWVEANLRASDLELRLRAGGTSRVSRLRWR